MDRIDFISFSAALFLASFIFRNYIYQQGHKDALTDLSPFLVLLFFNAFNNYLIDLVVFKIAITANILLKLAFHFAGKKITTGLIILIDCFVSLMVLLLIQINLIGVFTWINGLLIAATILWTVMKLKKYSYTQTKEDKDIFEVGLILFFAGIALGMGNMPFNLYLGISAMILYQITALALEIKHFHMANRKVINRLSELEEKFDRTVEFEAKKRTAQMADQVEHIRERSQKDPLSKALNRNSITNEITAAINDPSIKIFSIAVFDIDNFKSINDSKGHIVGDECIKFLSHNIMSNNRKTDLLGRYGGDEFILLMPHINAPAAIEVCNRIKNDIQKKSSPKFSISMGVATYPFDGRTFIELFEVADQGLYIAKESGRDQVAYKGNVPLMKK